MSEVNLPNFICPSKLARQQQTLQGSCTIDIHDRLANLGVHSCDAIQYTLNFSREETWVVVRGSIEATVVMRCQRCLQPVTLSLSVSPVLAMLDDEAKIETLPERYEPWLLTEDSMLSPLAMIEEELILALPLVPKHSDSCGTLPQVTLEELPKKPKLAGLGELLKTEKK